MYGLYHLYDVFGKSVPKLDSIPFYGNMRKIRVAVSTANKETGPKRR
jgi:hypothetical protein